MKMSIDFTKRDVRELAMIHPVDEISILQELGEIATIANVKYNLNN